MGELFSGDQEFTEPTSLPGLNTEFRTYLGSKTPYGKLYSIGLVQKTLVEFFLARGASSELITFRTEEGRKIQTTQADAIAGGVTNLIDKEQFKVAGKSQDIDDGEKQQLDMLERAVQNRIVSIETAIDKTPAEEKDQLERLQHELRLLRTLINN